jgi:hypothetical protein
MSSGNSPAEYVPSSQPAAPPPPKRMSAGKVILLVAGIGTLGLVGLIVLVVGLGFLFVWSSTTEEVTDADRELVVTAQELADQGWDVKVNPAAETIEKTRYLDRTADIEYEYDSTDDEEPLYINCSVHAESSPKDARASYTAMQVSALTVLKLMGDNIEQVDRSDLFRWGDESKCGLIVSNGIYCGNYFFARQGTKIYCLMITGVCIEEEAELRQLLLPHLEKLENHKL